MSVSATFQKAMQCLNETSEDITCRMVDDRIAVAYTNNNVYTHVIGADTILVLPLDPRNLPGAVKL